MPTKSGEASPTAEVDLDSYQDNSHKFGEGGLMDG